MPVCAACGHDNRDDLHFCERCGEYLRWDQPSEVLRQDPQPQPEPDPPPAQPDPAATLAPDAAAALTREPVQVVVEGGSADGTAVSVRVEPGAAARFGGVVRNQSGIVDAFDVALTGVPGEWWRADPAVVHLLPLGASGGACEERVEIVVEPPRAPEARAGAWPAHLSATSQTVPARMGAAPVQLEIAPYEQLEAGVRPERIVGAGRADYRLTVANRGNAPADVRLRGEDAEAQVEMRFEPAELRLAPGEQAVVAVRATAPRPASGADVERRLTLHAESGTVSAALPATFVQRPRVRAATALWWRVLLTLLAAALLIGGSFLEWADGLDGICLDGATGCLSYDVYVDRVADVQVERPDVGDRLAGPVDAVTSLGIVTVLLGALVLLGARTARLVWIAGAAAIVYVVVVLATMGDGGGAGSWMALLGGALAIAASLVAGIRRSG